MTFRADDHEIYPLPEDHCPYADLDPGIREYVKYLRVRGVETFESCEGGPGHCFPRPTIRFGGADGEGYRVVGLLVTIAVPILELRRGWSVSGTGVLDGPYWEIVLRRRALEC